MNCLFCASILPATYTIGSDGEVIRCNQNVKGPSPSSSSQSSESNQSPSSSVYPGLVFSVGEAERHIVEQLNVFFVLRKILQIPTEFLAKFLSLCEGDSHPELWVSVCDSCMKPVTQFYETVKDISKLENKLDGFREWLKGRIRNSEEIQGGGPIWRGIRTEALKVEANTPDPVFVPIPTPHADDDGNQDEEEGEEEIDITEDPLANNYFPEDDDDEAIRLELSLPLSQPPESFPNPEQPCPYIDFVDLVESDEEEGESSNSYQSASVSSPPLLLANGHNVQQPCSPEKKKVVKRAMDNSNPDFIAYSIGDKRFFECRHCAYTGQRPEWLRRHLLVHAKGSDAIPCQQCFWRIFPSKIPLHYRIHHPGIPAPQKKKGGTYNTQPTQPTILDLIVGSCKLNYKCSECVATFSRLEACQAHAKRHIKPLYEWCQE